MNRIKFNRSLKPFIHPEFFLDKILSKSGMRNWEIVEVKTEK